MWVQGTTREDAELQPQTAKSWVLAQCVQLSTLQGQACPISWIHSMDEQKNGPDYTTFLKGAFERMCVIMFCQWKASFPAASWIILIMTICLHYVQGHIQEIDGVCDWSSSCAAGQWYPSVEERNRVKNYCNTLVCSVMKRHEGIGESSGQRPLTSISLPQNS